MSILNVYVDKTLVGVLSEEGDIWKFSYEQGWATSEEGFDLAPGLPRTQIEHLDGGSNRPVQWYFDNLLPEEALRQAVSKEANIKGDNAFELLEYLGAESAGSLTLLPPGVVLPSASALVPLSDQELSLRIKGLTRQTLMATAPKRMSLAGAQHKLLVVYENGVLYEPVGATASTHILKPNHPAKTGYPASVINEYVTMRLARAAGLGVPEVHIKYVPQAVYIIDRFDRVTNPRLPEEGKLPDFKVGRLHIIDACQLLNKSRGFKYHGASIEALVDIIDSTTNKIQSRLHLFRWLVFNILVANDDAHLKNLSFFVSAEGTRVAPHYDLLATGAYYTKAIANENATWPNVQMAFALPNLATLAKQNTELASEALAERPLPIAMPKAETFGQVTERCILDAGVQMGLNISTVRRTLAAVIAVVPRALQAEKAAMEVRHAQLSAEAKPFAANEMRLISVVEHIIIKDMLQRMGA